MWHPVPKWNACTLLVCCWNSLLVLTAQMLYDWILVLVLFKCKNPFLFKFFFYSSNQILFHRGQYKSLSLVPISFFPLVIFLQKKGALYLFVCLLSVFPWIVSLIFNPQSFPALASSPLLFVSNSKADITSCLPACRKCKQSYSRAKIWMEGNLSQGQLRMNFTLKGTYFKCFYSSRIHYFCSYWERMKRKTKHIHICGTRKWFKTLNAASRSSCCIKCCWVCNSATKLILFLFSY